MRKIVVILIMMILAGCAAQIKLDESGATAQELNDIIDANNKFAVDLFSAYSTKEGNIFFSPLSISSAMAMTYEGAKGQTQEEIRSVFYFKEAQGAGYAKLFSDISRKDKTYALTTANALWAEQDFQFSKDYFNTVNRYYDGKVTNLNFKQYPEGSRTTINEWVEDKTNEKIKDLIPSGLITSATRLVLTNAIYFKGGWATQFKKDYTQKQKFKIADNKSIHVDMMQRTDDDAVFNYTETDKFQVLELPYAGRDLSMLIVLPKDDTDKAIAAETLFKLKNNLAEQRVNVFIPKFKFETKYFMRETLEHMGMPTAFTDNADFSGMTGKPDLKISEVIHQAFIEVNEEGTESSAATAVIMEIITSIGSEPQLPTFRANHPFVFIIQQKDTGNILFMGRVDDPTK